MAAHLQTPLDVIILICGHPFYHAVPYYSTARGHWHVFLPLRFPFQLIEGKTLRAEGEEKWSTG